MPLLDRWLCGCTGAPWLMSSNEIFVRMSEGTDADDRGKRSNGWWGHHKISTQPTNRLKDIAAGTSDHCRRHKWWQLVSQVWRTDIFPRRFADISRGRDSEKCEGRKIDGGRVHSDLRRRQNVIFIKLTNRSSLLLLSFTLSCRSY